MFTSPTQKQSTVLSAPWLLKEVALAQRELVLKQLELDAQGQPPAPFAAFHRTMQKLVTLCDAKKDVTHGRQPWHLFTEYGCGVGHYGVLLERHYPQFTYTGTDVSKEMIAHSLVSQSQIEVCEFKENLFWLPDIILASQVLEMLQDPEHELERLLIRMQPSTLLILHRLRMTPEPNQDSYTVYEPTYCGYPAQNFFWNTNKVLALLQFYGQLHHVDVWEQNMTILFQKGDDNQK